MKDALKDPTVIAAIVAGLVALLAAVIGYITRRASEREVRRRDSYAQAFEAYISYREFPFVVRRRAADAPAEERQRISGELRRVQERLGYFRAWIHTESRHCGLAFDRLVRAVRIHDGKLIHDGWTEPAITSDEQMNLRLPLTSLGAEEDEFLHEVSVHLSWRPRWSFRLSTERVRNRREEAAKLRAAPDHAPPTKPS